MWQQWITLALGLWVIISAYTNFAPDTQATNLTIVGLVIAALSLWSALEHEPKHDMVGQFQS